MSVLYRGQPYGALVGEWWTSSPEEAEKFGMSRGGNRTWVVLALGEDESEPWLAGLLYAERSGDGRGNWYRIPIERLREHWSGVRIHGGAISLDGGSGVGDSAADSDVTPPAPGRPNYGARNGAPNPRFGMRGRNDKTIRLARKMAAGRGHKLGAGVVTNANGIEVYLARCRCGRAVSVRDNGSPDGTALRESCYAARAS